MEIIVTEVGLALMIGLVAVLAFVFVNLFRYSLSEQSYDDALNEIRRKDKEVPKSPKKKTKKPRVKEIKSALVRHHEDDDGDDDSDRDSEVEAVATKASKQHQNHHQGHFRRSDSLRKEHVIFADEITADDARHSPIRDVENVEGILQNKEEVPYVDRSRAESDVDDVGIDEGNLQSENHFVDIKPLDELGLEIRRKSLQLTPTGSLGNSKSGSRTDLTNLNDAKEDADEPEEEEPHRRVLKFAEQTTTMPSGGDDQHMDVKKLCKRLRGAELTSTEINTIVEVLMRKEERSEWIDAKSSAPSVSILSQLRRDCEETQRKLRESEDLSTSLQAKLKQVRAEATDERRERVHADEAATTAKAEATRVKAEVAALRADLAAEKTESKQQQAIVRMALRRVCGNAESDSEETQEHRRAFERMLADAKSHTGTAEVEQVALAKEAAPLNAASTSEKKKKRSSSSSSTSEEGECSDSD